MYISKTNYHITSKICIHLIAGVLVLIVKASDHGQPQLTTREILIIKLQSFLTSQNNHYHPSSTLIPLTEIRSNFTQLSKSDATLLVALTAAALLVIFLVVFSIMMFLVYRRATGKEMPVVAAQYGCCCFVRCQDSSAASPSCVRDRVLDTSQCPVITSSPSDITIGQ